MSDLSDTNLQTTPASSKALWTILFIVFMDLLGFGIILPQLPFYGLRYHVSPVAVAALFAIYSICQFLAAPVLGIISDKYGRKPVLVFSQLGSAMGYVLLGVVTQLNLPNASAAMALIYLARIIDGISGGNISTAQAYISDVTTPQTRAKGMGLLGAAFGIGFAVGPILGGLIGNDTNHASWPAFTAGGFSFLAMSLSALWLPESNSHRPVNEEVWLHPSRFKPILSQPVLFQLLMISFTAMTAFTMLEGTIGMYLNLKFRFGPHHDIPYGMRQTSYYFAYIGLFIMYVQGRLMGQMVKKFGEWPVSVAGASFVTIGMILYVCTSGAPVLPLLLVAGAINAIGRSLQQPPIASLISKISKREEQGTVFGLYHGLGSLARSCGPIIAGVVYKFVHPTAQFALAGAMTACVAVWMALLSKKQTQSPRGFEVIPADQQPSTEATLEST
jgi:DHA1 family tetracycline resistance protein-like MFS transporter